MIVEIKNKHSFTSHTVNGEFVHVLLYFHTKMRVWEEKKAIKGEDQT